MSYASKSFAFRNFAGKSPDSESLRKELEEVYNFLDSKLRVLNSNYLFELGGLDARVSVAASALSDANRSIATLTTVVEANFGSNSARFEEIITAYADADQAIASQIVTLTATVGNNTAAISTEAVARADGDSALASTISTVSASVTVVSDGLSAEITDRVNGDATLASSITTLEASVVTESSARVTADEALASDITTVSASVTIEASARSTADSALADGLSTEIDDRIAGDDALTASITTLAASVTTESSARVTADAALASSITTVEASVTTVTASVATEATNRADADSALASDIATVAGSVTTEASARATADGQIHLKWGVALNANGRVTGRINLDGTNETSTLEFAADNIRYFDGSSTFNPFSITSVADGQAGFTATRSIFGDPTNLHLDFAQGSTGVTALRMQQSTNTVGTVRAAFYPSLGYGGTISLDRTWDSEFTLLDAESVVTSLVSVGSRIQKRGTSDGWTPILYSGDNSLSFKWDGALKVLVDATEYTITTT